MVNIQISNITVTIQCSKHQPVQNPNYIILLYFICRKYSLYCNIVASSTEEKMGSGDANHFNDIKDTQDRWSDCDCCFEKASKCTRFAGGWNGVQARHTQQFSLFYTPERSHTRQVNQLSSITSWRFDSAGCTVGRSPVMFIIQFLISSVCSYIMSYVLWFPSPSKTSILSEFSSLWPW